MRNSQLIRDSRRGQSLVVMALFLVVLMGMAALAIDLGMLQKARGDAQRAADGAALAGASAYLEKTFDQAVAIRRADSIATANDMGGSAIASSEITVEFPAANQVRVRVRRDAVPLWFGRVFGINTLPVGAWATAEAAAAGAAKCVKPFALPDSWLETDKVGQDKDADNFWDLDEEWKYKEPGNAGDCYRAFGGAANGCVETGYGSALRNGLDGKYDDVGRVLKLKPRDPQTTVASAWFYPVDLGGYTGAKEYQNGVACWCGVADQYGNAPANATLCHDKAKDDTPMVTVLDSVYQQFTEGGNMVGPTVDGVGTLVCQDPGALWDESTNAVVGSQWGSGWRDSPRVITIGLFDPLYVSNIPSAGNLDLALNNFVNLFVEGFEGCGTPTCNGKGQPFGGNCKGALVARFVGFAKGFSQGPGEAGSLVKYLRLIK